jgi:hypothetical protein
MHRLSDAICDENVSPTACAKQLKGVVRMLTEGVAPEGSGPPPPHSHHSQR